MRFIIYVTVSLAFFSCKYHLTEKSKQWNPYKPGDVLVFESTDKQLDTFFISDIEQSFTGRNEILKVNCRYPDRIKSSQIAVDTVHTFFMALTAWQNGETVFSFNLYTSKAKFYPFNAKRLTWIDSLPLGSVSNYEKVITFMLDQMSPTENLDANDSTLVNKVFWNKSNGLIGYTLKNKDCAWFLKKKYSL